MTKPIEWEFLQSRTLVSGMGSADSCLNYRAEVPGGWLIRVENTNGNAITFMPDPDHKWQTTPGSSGDRTEIMTGRR